IEFPQSRQWLVVNKPSLWLYSSQCLVICYAGAMATKYHHGNLRQEVLAAAADLIASRGVDALSMRDLARQAVVSHGAPAHHFGDRRGLLTALATDGFLRLATILEPSVTAEHFDQTAVAYVRFAATHPGHFDVMFRSECLDLQDRDLRAAQQR